MAHYFSSYDLINEKEDLDVDMYPDYYNWLLGLAEKYGWKPAGTTVKYGLRWKHGRLTSEWDGSYHSDFGAVVSEADAHAIAQALDRAKRHNEDAEIQEIMNDEYGRGRLEELQKLCRLGEFQIYYTPI